MTTAYKHFTCGISFWTHNVKEIKCDRVHFKEKETAPRKPRTTSPCEFPGLYLVSLKFQQSH